MEYLYQGIIQAFALLFAGDPETYSAVAATLRAASISMAASLFLGVPAGFALGHFRFPGRRQVRLVVDTFLALPTVFIGLMVYAFISRQGPLGDLGVQVFLKSLHVNLIIDHNNLWVPCVCIFVHLVCCVSSAIWSTVLFICYSFFFQNFHGNRDTEDMVKSLAFIWRNQGTAIQNQITSFSLSILFYSLDGFYTRIKGIHVCISNYLFIFVQCLIHISVPEKFPYHF